MLVCVFRLKSSARKKRVSLKHDPLRGDVGIQRLVRGRAVVETFSVFRSKCRYAWQCRWAVWARALDDGLRIMFCFSRHSRGVGRTPCKSVTVGGDATAKPCFLAQQKLQLSSTLRARRPRTANICRLITRQAHLSGGLRSTQQERAGNWHRHCPGTVVYAVWLRVLTLELPPFPWPRALPTSPAPRCP